MMVKYKCYCKKSLGLSDDKVTDMIEGTFTYYSKDGNDYIIDCFDEKSNPITLRVGKYFFSSHFSCMGEYREEILKTIIA